MRLSDEQIQTIKTTIAEVFGDRASVYLFGSRVNDHSRGGDIDLLVRSDFSGRDELERKVKSLARLTLRLGDRKIDLVTTNGKMNDDRPVVREALLKGLRL